MKIILVTGGFDPIHAGHIDYFNEAKKLGDKLIVGINSDAWLTRKKGKNFLPIADRVKIIENLKMVDSVILFNDDDNTAIEAIKHVKLLYPDDSVIFANGGDRSAKNVPEIVVPNILLKFGIGGNSKINSSSDLLEQWVNFKNNN